jgi:Icc protein
MVPRKIIQITDIHFVSQGKRLHGLDPQERLCACIRDINTHHSDADLCVLTGDLAEKGDIEAYRSLRDCLNMLTIPCHLMIGNHDNRENFLKVFPNAPIDKNGFIQSVIDTASGRFLLLDTVQQNLRSGSYCAKRGKWLKDQLAAAVNTEVYLFMHHPPFDIGIPCLDHIRLLKESDFFTHIIAPYSNIKHLFLGHGHRPVTGCWKGIPFSMVRGTNHQVPFDFDAVDVVPKSHEPPAYAVIFLESELTVVHFNEYLDCSVYPHR